MLGFTIGKESAILPRIASGAAVLLGAGLLAVPFVYSLFDRGQAGEDIANAVRPAMTQPALEATAKDFDTWKMAVTQFQDSAIPRAARIAGQDPAQFKAQLLADNPDVAAGLNDFPGIVTAGDGLINTLAADRGLYEEADSLSIVGLSLGKGGWAFIGLGVVLAAAGLASLRAPRQGLVIAMLAGAGMLVVPLAISLPLKLTDTATLVDDFKASLSPAGANQASTGFGSFDRMTVQLQQRTLPSLQQRMGMNQTQFDAFLNDGAPLLANGMPQVNASRTHLGGLTAALNSQVPSFAKASKIPFRALAWFLIFPGAAVFLLSGLALWALRPARAAERLSASPRSAA